jgi:hypothetical protein
VSHPGRTPSWDEIQAFCEIDGWEHIQSTDHSFFRKVLPSGEVLETHRSFSGNKSMSHDVFSVILRNQLKVSRAQFWKALQSGQAVDRPDPEVEKADPQYDAWVIYGLKKRGLTETDIRKMTPDEARAHLERLWAQQ